MHFLTKNKLVRRVLSLVLSFFVLGSMVAPKLLAQAPGTDGYYQRAYGGQGFSDWDRRGRASSGQEPGRTVGGSVGMAAGFIGGAALASVVIGAAGVAAWGPLAVSLIGSAITMGGAFAGAKLFSNLGGNLTEALGKDNMWMMIGAVAGAVAAIALLPATGIFAGAAGLLAKGMIGGLVGGVVARLFSNQLEAIATPRNLMLGMGALVGGLGGGIPGAIAGAVGGYALGAIMDDHFFSQPGDSVGNYLPFDTNSGTSIFDSLKNAGSNISNWLSGKKNSSQQWFNENYYGSHDPYYQHYYQQAYQGSYGTPYYGQNQQYYQYDSAPAAQNYYQYRESQNNQYQNLRQQLIQGHGYVDPKAYDQYRQNGWR